MKKWKQSVAAVFCMVMVVIVVAHAESYGKKEKKKVGILLIAFGSTIPEAQVSFENIDREVKASFSKIPVRWAYTSHMIRKKLARSGKHLDSPEVALAKMLDEGFTHVAVQSLHTIGGYEFHDLRRTVHQFQYSGGFKHIMLGFPLLSSQESMQRAGDAILANIPKDRKQNEGVVYMGHGTHHPSNAFYAALMFQVQRKDPHIFIGCVEGYPEINEIMAMLKEKNITKVFLMPFMSVAGNHARKDMAGDSEDSWKSILTKAGIESVPILKGTAEYENMVDIWVDHLGTILDRF